MKIKYGLFLIIIFLFNFNIFAQFDFAPEFYYILEDSVNIWSKPNLQGEVIGRLGLNDRIEVISNAGNVQKIEHMFCYWYRIRYNNIVGYIYGGYFAARTEIFDIDRNGISDYFHFRISDTTIIAQREITVLDTWTDMIIYINNKKISTQDLQINGNHRWRWCYFRKSDNKVIIELLKDILPGTNVLQKLDVFEIDRDGKIIFVGSIERYS
jgi:hypothetical protein